MTQIPLKRVDKIKRAEARRALARTLFFILRLIYDLYQLTRATYGFKIFPFFILTKKGKISTLENFHKNFSLFGQKIFPLFSDQLIGRNFSLFLDQNFFPFWVRKFFSLLGQRNFFPFLAS